MQEEKYNLNNIVETEKEKHKFKILNEINPFFT